MQIRGHVDELKGAQNKGERVSCFSRVSSCFVKIDRVMTRVEYRDRQIGLISEDLRLQIPIIYFFFN